MTSPEKETVGYHLPIVQQEALEMALDELGSGGSDRFEDTLQMRMSLRNPGLQVMLGELFEVSSRGDAWRMSALRTGMLLTHQLVDYQALLDTVNSFSATDSDSFSPTEMYAKMHAPVVRPDILASIRGEIIERGPFGFLDEATELVEKNNPKLSFGVFVFMKASSFRSPDAMQDGQFGMAMTHKFLSAQADAYALRDSFDSNKNTSEPDAGNHE